MSGYSDLKSSEENRTMQAIISDIHGNLEALHAVLTDIARNQVTEIICLGDLVGYGPDPIRCVEMAMEWGVVLQGNHDAMAVSDNQGDFWPPTAFQTILRFRREAAAPEKSSIYPFLQDLPTSHEDGDILYVHASPRDHLHEYVFPEDIYNLHKMEAIAARFRRLCFCGHTHLPGLFIQKVTEQGLNNWNFTQAAGNDVFPVEEAKILCNVGSVGQPRDGDSRAGYVLFDGKSIRFRRVAYDVQGTVEKLRNLWPTDDFVAQRLLQLL